MELAGALALLASLVAPWFYNGVFDAPIQGLLHSPPGVAHIVALVLVGIGAYAAVMLVARAVNTIMRLPVLGFGNAIGGAAIGLLKALVGVWIVLYVVLLFPLSPSIRADMRRSLLVRTIVASDARIDDAVIGTLPLFVRPLVAPLFARHRV